jgi:hypothetical protein
VYDKQLNDMSSVIKNATTLKFSKSEGLILFFFLSSLLIVLSSFFSSYCSFFLIDSICGAHNIVLVIIDQQLQYIFPLFLWETVMIEITINLLRILVFFLLLSLCMNVPTHLWELTHYGLDDTDRNDSPPRNYRE